MPDWRVYGKIGGPIVMIGFGSIGRGLLPLLERHFLFEKSKLVVIDPDDTNRALLDERGIRFIKKAVTPENYREFLGPLLIGEQGEQAFCINLSVDVSSLALVILCREHRALYIDTVIEPWAGFYFNAKVCPADRTNYRLREQVLAERGRDPGGTTAIVCCGANPGMVSWFVKQALINLAEDMSLSIDHPVTQRDWAELMYRLGVKGIHIAERDTQCSQKRKPQELFWNTWSVGGFVSEAMQPAELGWGTHERWTPETARKHEAGCKASIYLEQAGACTHVRTWCPTYGSQLGFLVTHNESISIADYFTLQKNGETLYRPTCHYAYHPCDDAILSLHGLFGKGGKMQSRGRVLSEDELVTGKDELGVLLYGHEKNAYWYGSQLSIEEARNLAPYQNATALQVTSGVLAGMVWAMENREVGIVEADELDYHRCLEIQTPYLGTVKGYYTDWTPLTDRSNLLQGNVDFSDPWQFRNVLVHP